MILFDNNMFVFSIQVLDGQEGVVEVKLINGFECDFDLMNFLISIVLEHEVTAPVDLFFVLMNPLVHLFFESVLDSLTQFWSEPVFDIDKNDEEEYSACFEFDILLLELQDLLL